MELHQVPGRPRRQRRRALRAEHRAGEHRRRHREASVACACLRRSRHCAAAGVRAGARRRAARPRSPTRQGAARRVPGRRDRLRSAGGRRRVLELRQPRDLRSAVSLRLPRAALQARPEYRRGAARDLGRRQDVDDPDQAGHLLRRRPGVQGQEARARRPPTTSTPGSASLDPQGALGRILQLFDGRFVGADAVVAKAKETGKFDYDAPIEGLQALDRYTMRFKLKHADVQSSVRPHDDADGRGRARGRSRPTATRAGGRWRIRSAPGPTG